VYYETQPTLIYVYADPEDFMEIVQSLTGQAAPTNAAGAAANRGAIVPMPALEPVQQQPMLAAAMVPSPKSSATESTISEEDEEKKDAPEAKMEESEEERAIKEGRFSLLPVRNTGADEPKLLNLFPLAPSSSHSVKDETEK
jgi:hypothetical protein